MIQIKAAVILCIIGATFPPVSISGRIPENPPTAAVAIKVFSSVGRIIIKAVAAPKAAWVRSSILTSCVIQFIFARANLVHVTDNYSNYFVIYAWKSTILTFDGQNP